MAFHMIAMVAWFAGLFYLPRLFIYHTETQDEAGILRFKKMERKLYFYIMWPAALLTTIFGFWLLITHFQTYKTQGWMHAKLACVTLLWVYHFFCGYLVKAFKEGRGPFSQLFYRIFNEIPSFLLIAIIILVVVKPF